MFSAWGIVRLSVKSKTVNVTENCKIGENINYFCMLAMKP